MSTSLDKITQQREVIAWFEIPASDFERAVEFYRNALSFKVQVILLNGVKHGIVRNRFSDARGDIVEAPTRISEGGPVLFFRAQYDVSLTLSNVVTAGGEIIVPKTLITDSIGTGQTRIPLTHIDNRIGYFAKFKDSEGNHIAIYGNS